MIKVSDYKSEEEIENEIKIQTEVTEHPNIIKMYSIYKFKYNEFITYFIELELAETSLEKIIHSKQN